MINITIIYLTTLRSPVFGLYVYKREIMFIMALHLSVNSGNCLQKRYIKLSSKTGCIHINNENSSARVREYQDNSSYLSTVSRIRRFYSNFEGNMPSQKYLNIYPSSLYLLKTLKMSGKYPFWLRSGGI